MYGYAHVIRFSISWDKFHFDIPIRPADKGDGHTNGLMVVLQSELLHHLDGEHVHLQLGKPPPDAHPRTEAERNGSEGMRSVLTRTSAQPALRLELLGFGKVLLVVHGEEVPVGDHCPAGDLVAAKHHVLGGLPVETRDCWLARPGTLRMNMGPNWLNQPLHTWSIFSFSPGSFITSHANFQKLGPGILLKGFAAS